MSSPQLNQTTWLRIFAEISSNSIYSFIPLTTEKLLPFPVITGSGRNAEVVPVFTGVSTNRRYGADGDDRCDAAAGKLVKAPTFHVSFFPAIAE